MNSSNILYTIDYFIKKFKAIPSSKWCTGYFEKNGKHCALGHCGCSIYTPMTEESMALKEIFRDANLGVVSVNDEGCGINFGLGLSINFKKKTPKTRILEALRYIKKIKE